MSTDTISLPDIPDLSGIGGDNGPQSEPFQNGWYKGTILAERRFTDKNQNERVFESGDAPSANGSSRNIRLQVEITRKSDGRSLNVSHLVNYRPEDLTAETVAAIKTQQEQVKEGSNEWGPLFRPFMTLQRLSKLQKIAGVRQLQKTSDGGLDLSAIYGKTAYFKLADDDRNPQYKAIADLRPDSPTKVPVL